MPGMNASHELPKYSNCVDAQDDVISKRFRCSKVPPLQLSHPRGSHWYKLPYTQPQYI
jgi:hypothetical protein